MYRSGVDAEALRWGTKKLAAAFPASFADEARAREVVTLWRELLDTHPWVTEPVLRRGVTRICWEHKGEFLPPPAIALDYLHAAQQEVRRETEKALPPPPRPGGPEEEGQMSAKEAAREYLRQRRLAK